MNVSRSLQIPHRPRLAWILIPSVVAALGFVSVPEALGFTAEHQCTHNQTLPFRFDGTWTTAQRDAFRAGAFNWNNRDGLANQDLVTVAEVVTGGIPVRRVSNSTLGGAFGDVPCAGNEIRMNETNSLAQMSATGAHEVGHYLGLPHSGDTSYGGDIPATMATAACGNLTGDQLSRSTIAQTDVAALAWHWDADVDNPATANASFENGTNYWGKVNATLTTATSGGGSNGPTYALVARTASSGSVYVSDQLHDQNDNDPMYVQAATRDTSSGASGAVSISFLRRNVDVASDTCTSYPTTGRNYNLSTETGPWTVIMTTSCVPISTTIWVGCKTTGYSNSGLSVDIRAQFNTARSHTVALDYLRVALLDE